MSWPGLLGPRGPLGRLVTVGPRLCAGVQICQFGIAWRAYPSLSSRMAECVAATLAVTADPAASAGYALASVMSLRV